MRMTDEAFTAAMESAVKRKGEGNIARARYYWGGQPSCIVGVAFAEAGFPLDVFERRLATDLVVSAGCSLRVARAARVAQILQDNGWAWGLVLEGYHMALDMYVIGMPPQTMQATIRRALEHKARSNPAIIRHQQVIAAFGAEAYNQIDVPDEVLTKIVDMKNAFATTNLAVGETACVTTFSGVVTATYATYATGGYVTYQKEHALVA